jgi:hypothetical protein
LSVEVNFQPDRFMGSVHVSRNKGTSHEPGLEGGRLGRFGRIHYPCAWVTSKAGKMPAVRFMGRVQLPTQQGASHEAGGRNAGLQPAVPPTWSRLLAILSQVGVAWCSLSYRADFIGLSVH